MDNEAISSLFGGIHHRHDDSELWITNSIVYHNVGGNINAPDNFFLSHTCTTPSSLVDDFYEQGNITDAPAFVDHAGGDYRLTADSPGVDAGIVQDWMHDATDLAGKPRVNRITDGVDMGAYQFHFAGTTILLR